MQIFSLIWQEELYHLIYKAEKPSVCLSVHLCELFSTLIVSPFWHADSKCILIDVAVATSIKIHLLDMKLKLKTQKKLAFGDHRDNFYKTTESTVHRHKSTKGTGMN